MRTELGTIRSATFGAGGYDDAMFGFAVTLGGASWGVGDFCGTWAAPPTEGVSWSVESQETIWVKAMRLLMRTLNDAKKQHVDQLKGVPIEATFDGNILVSWRVLTEVIP